MEIKLTKQAKPLVTFVIDAFLGVIIFLVIAFSAVAFRWMADYLLASQYSNFLTQGLSFIEYLIFGVDALLFFAFMVSSSLRLFRDLKIGASDD
ncbi:MAG: hypothetical protein PHQ60_13635 [Sideroxydans sp.]|nr:hypothetical protein [Sideroxydans sp.]